LTQAATLFESTDGHAVVTCHLGMMCELGNGLSRDSKRALTLHHAAPAEGNARCETDLSDEDGFEWIDCGHQTFEAG
jgi:hypothetical protein